MNSAERFSLSLNFTSGLLYYEVIGFLACRRKVCQAKALLISGLLSRTIGVDDQMIKATVTLCARPGCHLCEEAKVAIHASGCEGEFSLEEVNIDEDPALRERYGYDVPVIFINGVKVFKHRVDPAEFKRKLRRLART